MGFWRKIIDRFKSKAEPISVVPKRGTAALKLALTKAKSAESKRVEFSFQPPEILAGVVPKGKRAGFAMDSNLASFPNVFLPGFYGAAVGFPGFPKLAALITRAEYRQMASALSTELTREWIELTSSESAGDETKDKITKLTKKIEEIDLKGTIAEAAFHDCEYGRAQLFIDLANHDIKTPLLPSDKTVKKDTFKGVKPIEAMWTTPAFYNANDPTSDDFYKPPKWFMLGKEVHATRLLTIVTRPVPDMLKPAFNFAGMSLSQLAEPYVENWLRTRRSVGDLISNFSITALKTDLGAVLQGSGDVTQDSVNAESLINRAALFTANRDNQGLMLLDKEREDLGQTNVPLSGLDKLQAQSQEHMCAVSRLPAIILTGLSPTGLNASSEGEIRVFYDWIAAQQEAHWRKPIAFILLLLQLSMFGSIDPDISFSFVPLFQMSGKEEAEIRTADANRDAAYIDRGVVGPEEVREKLARDPKSGFSGLSLDPADVPNLEEEEDDEE